MAKSLKESLRFETRKLESTKLEGKERALVKFECSEVEDNRWGRRGEVFIPPRHPQNGSGLSDPEASTLAKTENNSAWLVFYGGEYLRYVRCFEHLFPPNPLLVSPSIVRLVLKLNFKI
jgi:hypothetical protein